MRHLGPRFTVVANRALITVNMFTENVKPRGRGRPPGRTAQGAAARDRLYHVATGLIAERGYEATTLREIADRAGVSVGLLYRYFPNKRAIVLALYENLSREYAEETAGMQPGRWRDRFLFALATSLRVLGPHRTTLRALVPVVVGDPEDGLFANATAFSRVRVAQAFQAAVTGATDAPPAVLADATGRLLYFVHLGVILLWLLDRTPSQRATAGLVTLMRQILPSAALALRLPAVRRFVRNADALFREALFDDPGEGEITAS